MASRSPSAIERVGYIGVGHMGAAIARQVRAAGFDLMVYDLRPEAVEPLRQCGAKVATSPRDLGAHAQLLEVSIAGDDEIAGALFGNDDDAGIVGAMAPGSAIALHSTMNPAAVKHMAARAGERRVHVVDAPVSGGRRAAQEHTLLYMIGGDAAVVERCRPVFAAAGGRNVFHLGPLGAGAIAKIAQQMLTCANIVAVAESVRLAAAAEINATAFLEVVALSTAQSGVADRWQGELARVGPELTEAFYLSLKPALELARELREPVPVTELARELVRQAFGGAPA